MSAICQNVTDRFGGDDLDQIFQVGCFPNGITLDLRDKALRGSNPIPLDSSALEVEAISDGAKNNDAMTLDVEQRATRLGLGMDSITILIAAYNERESLENIVSNVQRTSIWQLSAKKEIIICLNGCTDDSPEIAKSLSQQHPEIKIISTPIKSKNAAWELLVKASDPASDALFFVDADVGIDQGAFLELDRVLQSRSNISLVGAFPKPFNPVSDAIGLFQKGTLRANEDPGVQARRAELYQGLCGGCYAIRRERAMEVIMPTDPRIADDQYLQFSLQSEFIMAPEAQFHFGVASFVDYVRQQARQRVARKVLREEYPDVFDARAEAIARQPPKNFSETAFAQASPAVKLHIVLGRVASLIGTVLSEYYLRTGADPWTKVASTKGWSFAQEKE